MAERHSSSALDSLAARITQDTRRVIAAPLDWYTIRACLARTPGWALLEKEGEGLQGALDTRQNSGLWRSKHE